MAAFPEGADQAVAAAEALVQEPHGSTVVGIFWFVVIAFMFFAQHHTCDVYFVPAINVFVDKMRGSKSTWLRRWGEESVAGATICALGCNGPELFSNLISLYTGSDAGIGVVVGSEIFNLLVIVGCSVVVAPVVPLQLEWLSFTRDCTFYAISIILLYGALRDRTIQFYESCILLFAAVCYVAAVYFTKDLEDCLNSKSGKSEPLLATSPSDTGEAASPKLKQGPSFQVIPGAPSGTISEKHIGTMHGVKVEVEEIFHGRIVDGHKSHIQGRYVDALANNTGTKTGDELNSQIDAFDRQVSEDLQLESECGTFWGPSLRYRHLKEVVVMGQGVIELEFEKGFMAGFLLEHITLKLTAATSTDRDHLLQHIEKHTLGRAWVHGYDASVKGSWSHLVHNLKDPDMSLFLKVFFCLPEFLIDACLRITLYKVDIKDINLENRWPLCFLGAMGWLAFFSWCMLECANQIHANIPWIPTSFLGITVCAVGTSFPNAVASIILSQQNKPAAAIANALGSNVQNVFLAMAMPWAIFAANYGFKDIPQDVAGIQEGVMWMVGTLLLVVIFVLIPPGFCALSTTYGWILNFVYVIYLVITMGETFGWWPPLMK
eukprot:TRINITY_DN44761_c0_g1_i1.p1 TRINITY_DN44761_c0_g1~~TRINITY_DN44761_c0_g1_i1.p1  ORF type:complete len:604 (-),score=97.73 TRINITY_DN44761_c0_g1_i1:163-1974(-)